MTHDEIIAVVTAHKEGKEIERQDFGRWAPCPRPDWDFSFSDYRVKVEPPKPREWWLNDHLIAYGSETSARIVGCTSNPVHVREVLP